MPPKASVFIIGFGNPGRMDDGLGPIFAERLGQLGLEDVELDSDYQLNVEDAATIAEYEYAIFVDASVSCKEPFEFNRLDPKMEMSFSSHNIQPEHVLALSRQLFKAKTQAFVLAIRGYEFEMLVEKLSQKAIANLEESLTFLVNLVKSKRFDLYL